MTAHVSAASLRSRALAPAPVPAPVGFAPERCDVSVVVPLFNEEDSLATLCRRVAEVMAAQALTFELIFVDDGSRDASPARIAELGNDYPQVRCITFRRNFGKAAALDAGFRVARGAAIVTMDADLQDDPAEIPHLLATLDAGYDVVSGWKTVRHDPWHKTLPSKVFNTVVARLSGLQLKDFNCGLKAYRAEAVADLTLYGELHRFIPVLLHWRGFRIGEISVSHHPRRAGQSKYGMTRLLKGGLDFLGVMLNTRFATRPLHVFGTAGLGFGFIGTTILLYLTALWCLGLGPVGDRPLLMLGVLMIMTGFQFLTIGLLGEFIQRQGAGRERRYCVRSTSNLANRFDVEALAGAGAADRLGAAE